MPVDLSKIGLDGQESFYRRMNSAAQSQIMAANADAKALENEHTRRINELNDIAAGKLSSVTQREGQPMEDPAEAAERMNSLADPLLMVADIYAAGGAMQEATELFKQASTVRKQESDIENDAVTNQQNRLENILKGADIVGRQLGGAQSPDEWRLGIENIERALKEGVFVMDPEQFAQIKDLPYDPDMAAFFKAQALSAAEDANIELRRVTNDRLERVANLNEDYKTRSLKLSQARLEEQKRHNRHLEKGAGTKPVGAPTKDQLKSAEVVIESEIFPDGVSKGTPQFKAATQYIAAQAMEIVRSNHAINWDTALRQAAMRAKKSGVIERDASYFGDDDLIFSSGKLPESAIPIPAKADGSPDPKAMKKGYYYITARGRARWNGNEFELD